MLVTCTVNAAESHMQQVHSFNCLKHSRLLGRCPRHNRMYEVLRGCCEACRYGQHHTGLTELNVRGCEAQNSQPSCHLASWMLMADRCKLTRATDAHGDNRSWYYHVLCAFCMPLVLHKTSLPARWDDWAHVANASHWIKRDIINTPNPVRRYASRSQTRTSNVARARR